MNPSDTEAVERALEDFFQAMELRTRRNLRVANRVTAILRVSMVSFTLFAILMATMIWAFTDRVESMIGVLGTMRIEFTRMAHNTTEMRETLERLEGDMASFTVVTEEVHAMRATIGHLNAEVQEMGGRMVVMTGDVSRVAGNLGHMNHSFRLLSPSVARIGANVDRGSGPIKTFNKMFPFP